MTIIVLCGFATCLALGIAIGVFWERYKPGEVDDGPLN